jgi:hypothetical protein
MNKFAGVWLAAPVKGIITGPPLALIRRLSLLPPPNFP